MDPEIDIEPTTHVVTARASLINYRSTIGIGVGWGRTEIVHEGLSHPLFFVVLIVSPISLLRLFRIKGYLRAGGVHGYGAEEVMFKSDSFFISIARRRSVLIKSL